MAALMAVGAKRHSIGDAVRTFLGQMLNVVNFKIRQAVLLKWRRLVAAFTDAVGFISHPSPYLRITHISCAGGWCSFRVQNALWGCFNLLLLKCGSSSFERFFIGCRGEFVNGQNPSISQTPKRIEFSTFEPTCGADL